MEQYPDFDPSSTIAHLELPDLPVRPKTDLEVASQALEGAIGQLFASLLRLHELPGYIASHVHANDVSVCGQTAEIYYSEGEEPDVIPSEYVVCISLGQGGGELTMDASLGAIQHPKLTTAGDVDVTRRVIERMIEFAETGTFF